jgi:hypothetical protein
MSGFDLSYTANMFIIMILYDFFLSSAQLCYTFVYIRKVESRVQIADPKQNAASNSSSIVVMGG